MGAHVRIGIGLVACAVWIGGCGAADRASCESTRIPHADPPQRSGLVWMTDAHGQHHTLWVSLEGEPLASQPIDGPLWADGDTLWQWVEEPVPVPVFDGRPVFDEPPPALAGGTRSVRRGVLRDLSSDLEVVAVEAPAPGPVREIIHEVRLVASVGPYVFATERLTVDAFGAHGESRATAHVWDLRAAAPAQVLTERERTALARGPLQAARRALLDQGAGLGVAPEGPPDDVALVALWPRWDLERGLAVELQIATEVCYACSDGRWSDYTRSVRLPARRVYERLAEHAAIPRWVRRTAAERPDERVAGFTEVTRPEPAWILDTLRRAPATDP